MDTPMSPPACWRGWPGPPRRPARTGHRWPKPLEHDLEHDAAQELCHPAQIVLLAHMQHVTAGEPVQRTTIPVLPQHDGLTRWSHTIAEAGDDHPALLRHQRPIIERGVVRQSGG